MKKLLIISFLISVVGSAFGQWNCLRKACIGCADTCNINTSFSVTTDPCELLSTITGEHTPFSQLWSNGATATPFLAVGGNTYIVTITDDIGCTKVEQITLDKNACTDSCGSANLTFPTDLVNDWQCDQNNYRIDINNDFMLMCDPCCQSALVEYEVEYLVNGSGSWAWDSAQDSIIERHKAKFTLNCGQNGLDGIISGFILCGNNFETRIGDELTTIFRLTSFSTSDKDCLIESNVAVGTEYIFTEIITTQQAECCPPVVADAVCVGSTPLISVDTDGGYAPYTFLWSTAETTRTINANCSINLHTVTVTDAIGNTTTASITPSDCPSCNTINTCDGVNLTASPIQTSSVTCTGDSDGSALIVMQNVGGGTLPFTIEWHDGTTQTGGFSTQIDNLSAGTYNITITDDNGCQSIQEYTIGDGYDIGAGSFIQCNNIDVQGPGVNELTVTGQSPNSGSAPYTYVWSDGTTGSTHPNPICTIYQVTVTDNNGCTTVKEIDTTSCCP